MIHQANDVNPWYPKWCQPYLARKSPVNVDGGFVCSETHLDELTTKYTVYPSDVNHWYNVGPPFDSEVGFEML